MKSAYELYTEWTKGRSRVAVCLISCELEAFRAGMLAAADNHDLDWYSAEEIAVAINIEEAIREAAK